MRKPRVDYNHAVTTKSEIEPRSLKQEQFTSMQAARISGVPFFTVDYWDRSRFLRPTLALGQGRGRGRERMYSYADVVRLRIARELRDEKVSLETLRRVVQKLGQHAPELTAARYVLVGSEVEMLQTPQELLAKVSRPGRRTFGILLDLTTVSRIVEEGARKLLAAERRRPRHGF